MIVAKLLVLLLLVLVCAFIIAVVGNAILYETARLRKQREKNELKIKLEEARMAIQLDPEAFTIQTPEGPRVLTPEEVVGVK